jgi:hypothetical protein
MAVSRSFGRQIVHHPVADRDGPAGDLLQPGDRPQRGGLSAPGRTDEDHELAVGDFQVQVIERFDVTAVDLLDMVEGNLRHGNSFIPYGRQRMHRADIKISISESVRVSPSG